MDHKKENNRWMAYEHFQIRLEKGRHQMKWYPVVFTIRQQYESDEGSKLL